MPRWYESSSNSGGRKQRLLQLLCSPSDLWLMIRIMGWALILPILKRIFPLRTLAKFLWSAPKIPDRNFDQEQKIATVIRWIYVFVFSNEKSCIQRSLILYRYLSLSHSNPQLYTGIRREKNDWKGHAWILVDGKPFGDFDSHLEDFRPLLSFGEHGVMTTLYQS
jgi:hypothetical protein